MRAKRADRALARGVGEGPGGWPPRRGCKGAAPPCLRKFCILRAKYAEFQAPFQKYMIFGGRKGAAVLFIRECVFGGSAINAQFQSLPVKIYTNMGCFMIRVHDQSHLR